jgi:hypothetical protein
MIKQISIVQAYTFTLLFRTCAVALLRVYGIPSQDEARAVACCAFPSCAYEVRDGDQSSDSAAIFYSWTCSEAQEAQLRLGRQARAECGEVRL